ncbi:MAG: ABC transporter permease [Anaerolineales bacterium]|nr:ABC transporter permease [Anaerolineales bacterium]
MTQKNSLNQTFSKKPKRTVTTSSIRSYAISLVLLLLLVVFSLANPMFFRAENLFNVTRQVAMLGISAVGMTFVLLAGGIDLSVGSLLSLVSVVCAKLMVEMGLNPAAAVLTTLLMCAGIGALNAFFINEVNIPPLITTLGSMTILRGTSYVLSDGRHIWGFPDQFRVIGQGYLGPFPVPVILMVLFFLFGWAFLTRTPFGRWTYGIGDNEEATRLSGINVKKMKYLLYILSSLLTGIAGIILLSRMSSGQPKVGTGYELEVVTAVVLGGVSIFGGQGKLLGVLFGVLIIGVLENGMILMNISDYYQQIILGFVLLAAVGFDNKVSGRLKKNT